MESVKYEVPAHAASCHFPEELERNRQLPADTIRISMLSTSVCNEFANNFAVLLLKEISLKHRSIGTGAPSFSNTEIKCTCVQSQCLPNKTCPALAWRPAGRSRAVSPGGVHERPISGPSPTLLRFPFCVPPLEKRACERLRELWVHRAPRLPTRQYSSVPAPKISIIWIKAQVMVMTGKRSLPW